MRLQSLIPVFLLFVAIMPKGKMEDNTAKQGKDFHPQKMRSVCSMIRKCSPNTGKARTGIIPGLKQCVILKGVCKDGGCTSTDSTIGVCNDEKKCCRRWWVLWPYPTPIPRSKSP
ncbi:beta-defensin 130A-like [Glossophaga mutica]